MLSGFLTKRGYVSGGDDIKQHVTFYFAYCIPMAGTLAKQIRQSCYEVFFLTNMQTRILLPKTFVLSFHNFAEFHLCHWFKSQPMFYCPGLCWNIVAYYLFHMRCHICISGFCMIVFTFLNILLLELSAAPYPVLFPVVTT